MMPKGLAFVYVGNVNLDNHSLERIQRVENGDRRVRKCRRINHDAGGSLARFVNPVDDLVFAIALAEFDIELQLRGNFPAIVLDIPERIVTLDVRLALPQQIEIRAIENVDKAAHVFS